jgi:hypothetical protein
MPAVVRSHEMGAASGLIELVGLELMTPRPSQRPLPNSDASRQPVVPDLSAFGPTPRTRDAGFAVGEAEAVRVISVRVIMSLLLT